MARALTRTFRPDGFAQGGQALDENAHGGAVVERNAGAIDEAKAGGGAGNFSDEGGFPEAHLPNTLAKTLISPKFAHTASRASRKLAEGMKIEGQV